MKKLKSAHNLQISELENEIRTERGKLKEAVLQQQKESDRELQSVRDTHRQVLKTLRQTIEQTANEHRLEVAKCVQNERDERAGAARAELHRGRCCPPP